MRECCLLITPKQGNVFGGLEAEFNLRRIDGTLPDAQDNDRFYVACHQSLGDVVSVEPGAHMIEIKTQNPASDPKKVMTQFSSSYAVLDRIAHDQGLIIANRADMNDVSLGMLCANLISSIDPATVQNRHLDVKMEAADRIVGKALRAHACSTASIQYTHAVTDADNLHRWMRVHYAMMPLYLSVFDNSQREENGIHTAITRRADLGERGLMRINPFEAKNGFDLMERYSELLTDLPLLLFTDGNGNLASPKTKTVFGDLSPSLQNVGNFMAVANGLWTSCKIKPLFNAFYPEKLDHLLLEVRDMDTGLRNITPVVHLFAPMTRQAQNVGYLEHLLEREAGIPLTYRPKVAFNMSVNSLEAVRTTPGLAVTFGAITMRDAVDRIIIPVLKRFNPQGQVVWKEFMGEREKFFSSTP